MANVIITIGGEDNYIVDQKDGPDMLIQNDHNSGEIIAKLGSNTSTSSFSIENPNGPVFICRGDKTTLFDSNELKIENAGRPADQEKDFIFVANNDADTQNVEAILHYDVQVPTLSYPGNVLYKNNAVIVSDNNDVNYQSSWLLSGRILRSCNTAVTDTLPTPSALVGAIRDAGRNTSFLFSIECANIRASSTAGDFIKLIPQVGVTWDKNDSWPVEYIVPGQVSTFRISLTNVTVSSEAYSIRLIGSQGERRGDWAIRNLDYNETPVTGNIITSGSVVDLPTTIGHTIFERSVNAYTFFETSGTDPHIINLGPPICVSIFARICVDHTLTASRYVEFNITVNGVAVWADGALGGRCARDDPGPFISINYPYVPLDTGDQVSISIKSISASININIYTCQLAVYQIS